MVLWVYLISSGTLGRTRHPEAAMWHTHLSLAHLAVTLSEQPIQISGSVVHIGPTSGGRNSARELIWNLADSAGVGMLSFPLPAPPLTLPDKPCQPIPTSVLQPRAPRCRRQCYRRACSYLRTAWGSPPTRHISILGWATACLHPPQLLSITNRSTPRHS